MTSGAVTPALDDFRAAARTQPVVPLSRRLLADGETPVGVYRKLAGERPGTFLLESAEHGGVWSRYSFVGVRSVATLTERDGEACWIGTPPAGAPVDGDPLAALAATAATLRIPADPRLPPLTGGLVGYLGYDLVRRLERLPTLAKDDLAVPELAMMLATDVAVLDHADGSIILMTNVLPPAPAADGSLDTAEQAAALDAAYHRGVARLDAMTLDLTRPAAPSAAVIDTAVEATSERRMAGDEYQAAVVAAKEQIFAGEAFQVVVSQRFERATTASALDIYRVLRVTNPSPYMYLLRFDDFDVVGSSPEVLVKVDAGKAMLHPIAGTRPRGTTPEEDAALAAELLADPKERAEHLMLVDLGRNDLGRVCVAGTVEVIDFMSIERYSHVMHIVSTVVGSLPSNCAALDVLTAGFPAGTVSGAPKPRAMEIIEELEPTRRGLYAGAVGYVGFSGDLDTAIAIRTALLRDGVAYVQAGAGIVADSDPAAEDAECRNKAAAVLRAIAAAETLRPAR
jgi:anthranilate synthase component I